MQEDATRGLQEEDAGEDEAEEEHDDGPRASGHKDAGLARTFDRMVARPLGLRELFQPLATIVATNKKSYGRNDRFYFKIRRAASGVSDRQSAAFYAFYAFCRVREAHVLHRPPAIRLGGL